MKAKQIKVAMAILEGLVNVHITKQGEIRYRANENRYALVPDYTLDYNSVHRVMLRLSDDEITYFVCELEDIIGDVDVTVGPVSKLFRAVPLQMCEAILRAKGLWINEPKEDGQ